MQFSEAMLLGLPEIKFMNTTWFTQLLDGTCAGCLVGAALYGVRGNEYANSSNLRGLVTQWPWIKTFALPKNTQCPGCSDKFILQHHCDQYPISFLGIMTHLANHYGKKEMSAEAIADWIHQFEPKEHDLPEKLVEQVLNAAPTLEADVRDGKLISFEEAFEE